VASGYNVSYKKLDFRGDEDVVMVALRMIGTSVRSLFEKGKGIPCFVSSEQVRRLTLLFHCIESTSKKPKS
jgi:ketol-acid reductoisomerase